MLFQQAVLVVLMSLLTTACGSIYPIAEPNPPVAGRGVPTSVGPTDAPACHQPLANACDADGCPTYDVAAAEFKTTAKTLGYGCSAGTGTCGDLRFVHLGNGFVANTLYFDASGTMVAAVSHHDSIDPTCHGRFTFGRQVSCERVPVEGYCPEVPVPPFASPSSAPPTN